MNYGRNVIPYKNVSISFVKISSVRIETKCYRPTVAMWDQIVEFVFSIQFTAFVLILIGVYALLWWSIDNFKSIIQIIRSFLVPYFQPHEDIPLSEKFGSWAGIE